MRVLLINPPPTRPNMQPYILEVLANICYKEGIDCTLYDLNIRLFDYLWSNNINETVLNIEKKLIHNLTDIDKCIKNIKNSIGLNINVFNKSMNRIEQRNRILNMMINSKVSFGYIKTTETINCIEDIIYSKYIDIYMKLLSEVPNIKEDILKESYDLICITAMTIEQVIFSFSLSKIIKKLNPNVHITLGGSIVSRLKLNFTNRQIF